MRTLYSHSGGLIHIYDEDNNGSLCGRWMNGNGWEIGEMNEEQWRANYWHCKRCEQQRDAVDSVRETVREL